MGADKQYVVFRLEGQLYGAEITVVREVSYLTPITRLPNTPPYVEGVIDLRGEVMPVIDIRKRLGLPSREADSETRVMILSVRDMTSALVVDGVEQVLTLSDEQITAPDQRVTVAGQDYVVGVARSGEQLVIIMDLARMLNTAAV
ncbi:MAG: chemotaxis protein CheW [Bacillota bacterium]